MVMSYKNCDYLSSSLVELIHRPLSGGGGEGGGYVSLLACLEHTNVMFVVLTM